MNYEFTRAGKSHRSSWVSDLRLFFFVFPLLTVLTCLPPFFASFVIYVQIESGTGRFVGRYVCVYPNCGRAFTRLSLAESHALNFHQHRSRPALRRSLPKIDQYAAPFWPEEAPFVATGKEVTGA